ncbi:MULTISPECIES: spore coat protein GerQ [Clostridia]|uniref:spore coat protein GerQ n=1 Tax=Clostridia TaxID=186801 RepID=UPI000EA274B9|nr:MULTISPECIES: spore coat protein GerQ [Clostridia]NBJ69718.1 spore coat protein GerQ [Roseburia sp. 1XD42-34]RKI78083.1 spore coat protein GerQ [Clostridium sp. 1xD42-85]
MSDNQNSQHISSYQPYPYYYYPAASSAYYPMYPMRQQPTNQPYQQSQTQPYPPAAGGTIQNQPMLPEQQSYIENILRLNRGKEATVYMTFENNEQWNAKVFRGIIEAAGRDHIVLSDPQTGKRYLLLMVYLDYIVFDEELNYAYPFGNTSYSPR